MFISFKMVHKKKKQKKEEEVKIDESIKDEPEGTQLTSTRRSRIIVRNLPFANLSKDVIENLFKDYGQIIDINLLTKPNGKFVGCGFVEFDKKISAARAIAHVNGKNLNGRPVIVDWALPKNTYLEKMQKPAVEVKDEPISDDDDDKDGIVDTKPDVTDSEDDNNDDDDDEESDDEDMDEEFDDEDMEEEIDDLGSQSEANFDKPRKKASNDVDEGKTVFLKNVPFSATNDDVKKAVAVFGPVVYALICVDKLTEHSKGSAFVKFKEKDGAEKCLKNKTPLTINGQQIEVTQAVSKSKLDEEKKLKKLKVKDSRNLYLVREGVVLAGSPAAATVSAHDMAKRLEIEQWKTQILRNLNMFVSRTRIVVHNLPPDYDDAKLRKMVEAHSKWESVIKEARVMQNRSKSDSHGNPLSKEVGFVSFTNHEDALYALRAINNNPKIFTEAKRPIVSFSIENREILNIKQRRLEKSRVKNLGDKANDKALLKLNKKQRRFLKRKQKLIAKRQESKSNAKNGGENAQKQSTVASKETGTPSQGVKKLQKKSLNKPTTDKTTKKIPHEKDKLNEKAAKRKILPTNSKLAKKPKLSETTNDNDFIGAESVPGKKLKMRSRIKLKKQAEIHKNRLKELKKVRKVQQNIKKRKQNKKDREPRIKPKKEKFSKDDSFSKLVNAYKDRIEKSTTYKKWYDS